MKKFDLQNIEKLANFGYDMSPEIVKSIQKVEKGKKGTENLKQFLEDMLAVDPEYGKETTTGRVIILGSASLAYDNSCKSGYKWYDLVRISLPSVMIYKPSYTILVVSNPEGTSLTRFALEYRERPKFREFTRHADGSFKLILERSKGNGLSGARLEMSTSSTAETYLIKFAKSL